MSWQSSNVVVKQFFFVMVAQQLLLLSLKEHLYTYRISVVLIAPSKCRDRNGTRQSHVQDMDHRFGRPQFGHSVAVAVAAATPPVSARCLCLAGDIWRRTNRAERAKTAIASHFRACRPFACPHLVRLS